MADLLLLYPNRKSLPNERGKLKDIVELASEEIRTLREKVAVFERAQFGKKSERTAPKDIPEMIADLNADAETIDINAETQNDEARNRNKDNYKHNGRNAFSNDFVRRRVVHDLEAKDKFCPHCQAALTQIGEECVEQLGIIPMQFFVWLHTRLKYACRNCCQHVALAKMPKQPIDKGAVSAEVLAFIAMSKYQDFLPLYRIQRQFARYNLFVARSTLSSQMEYTAKKLEPLYNLMKAELLLRDHLFTDDTRMPFLDPGAGKTKTGRMWTFVGKEGENGQKPITVYHFAPNHQGTHIKEFLKNFAGYLQTDRCPNYDALITPNKKDPDAILWCIQVACMAHVRRKFVETLACNPRSIASEALVFINALYSIEHKIAKAKMNDEQKRRYRLKQSKPILNKLHQWLKKHKRIVTPSSLLGKAIAYTLNAWPYLQTFLKDGRLEIDNNRAERAMKPPVMGRKNSLFVGSQDGGKTAAILWSIFETCRQNNINAFEYITDVLKRLPTNPKDRLRELMPQYWVSPTPTSEQTATKMAA